MKSIKVLSSGSHVSPDRILSSCCQEQAIVTWQTFPMNFSKLHFYQNKKSPMAWRCQLPLVHTVACSARFMAESFMSSLHFLERSCHTCKNPRVFPGQVHWQRAEKGCLQSPRCSDWSARVRQQLKNTEMSWFRFRMVWINNLNFHSKTEWPSLNKPDVCIILKPHLLLAKKRQKKCTTTLPL